MINKITRRLAVGILSLAALCGSVTASEKFEDGATVNIAEMPDRGGKVFVLEKTGEDKKHNAGTYRIRHKSTGHYLSVSKPEAGEMVGWTTKDTDATKGSEWILFKNSGGWSIMAKGNAANAVSRSEKSSSGLELQRNQGHPHQGWKITKQE